MPAFTELSKGTQRPRRSRSTRRENGCCHESAEDVPERIDLAFQYGRLRQADPEVLATLPTVVSPEQYQQALHRLTDRDDWTELIDPTGRRVYVDGQECHGTVDKLLRESDAPPKPSIVSSRSPPVIGVWQSDAVRAVAAATALGHERDQTIPWAIVEYPAAGVVRDVRLTARRKATYRRVLRTIQSADD